MSELVESITEMAHFVRKKEIITFSQLSEEKVICYGTESIGGSQMGFDLSTDIVLRKME